MGSLALPVGLLIRSNAPRTRYCEHAASTQIKTTAPQGTPLSNACIATPAINPPYLLRASRELESMALGGPLHSATLMEGLPVVEWSSLRPLFPFTEGLSEATNDFRD